MKRIISLLITLTLFCVVFAGCNNKALQDGIYSIEVKSSSSMFRIIDAQLTISGGEMTAVLTLSGTGYEKLYMGTGEKALQDSDDKCVYFVENAEGKYTYEVPVAALDQDIDCAAWSIRKQKWYDRVLSFDSSTLSKKTTGVPLAGNSSGPMRTWQNEKSGLGNDWEISHSVEVKYAENFEIDYYDGGYALLSISDGSRFLTVPPAKPVPDGIDKEIVVLQQPIEDIYLVATSVMCLFDALDAMDSIALSGLVAEDWYVENAKAAMNAGKIVYAGKYNKPDYELILSTGCSLAVESTMIEHVPAVKEKLQSLGIPVFVERSSYESHPLGRVEWIKMYAALLGKEELADKVFSEQAAYLDELSDEETTGKTVAFFYVSSNGSIIARKSGDYITKMIEIAGGKYVFDFLGDPDTATSTVTLEMEQFYATAKEADYIIYNSTIDSSVKTLDDLMAKSNLFADFKAVQSGNVWCTDKNLFQETTQIGLMTSDIHRMLTEGDQLSSLNYMYKLQ